MEREVQETQIHEGLGAASNGIWIPAWGGGERYIIFLNLSIESANLYALS